MQRVAKHRDFSVKHGGTYNEHSPFKGQNIFRLKNGRPTGIHDEDNKSLLAVLRTHLTAQQRHAIQALSFYDFLAM
jgi:hypothetical protein